MTTAYRVRNWNENFEVWQSRRVEGALSWVGMPTKHDGKSFRRLMRKTNGPALFGCWCLIVQIAAKCPARGTLADSDGPLTSDDMEAKTGCEAELFTEAMEVLSSKEINWVESFEFSISNLPPVDSAQPTLPTEPNPTNPTDIFPAAEGGGNLIESKSGTTKLRALDAIKAVHLASDKAMEMLRDKLAQECPSKFKKNDSCLLAIIASSERAIEIGKKPIALFVSLIREQQWGILTEQQHARAAQRLKDYRRTMKSIGDGQ